MPDRPPLQAATKPPESCRGDAFWLVSKINKQHQRFPYAAANEWLLIEGRDDVRHIGFANSFSIR
eukprot:6171896-Pleurochrysis_carterae.AAC.4